MACTGLSGFQWKEMITDIDVRANAITFQTGNVFYEILFSAINKNLIWINYLYFGFSVLTLVFGTISISCASQLSYWMNDLQTDTKKSYFAFRFRHYESMLFASFLGMDAPPCTCLFACVRALRVFRLRTLNRPSGSTA